jgi:hypothetical protein
MTHTTKAAIPIDNKLSNRQRKPDEQIIVYICPTEGCENHYASNKFKPGDPGLITPSRRRTDDGVELDGPTRLECPDCRARGITVSRVPYIVTMVLPLSEALQRVRGKNAKPVHPVAL